MTGVVIEAPAKINLRLVVLSREASGYHTLETLFCGVSLSDTIEIAPSATGIELEVSGDIDVGPTADNLVLRAARAFHERLGETAAIHIRLEKRIPVAAGLGGGSSDAAATLRVLNELHGRPFDDAALRTIGAALGSDVAFFLTRTPFAFAWSRGERLLELEPPEERPVLIVFPGVAIPTPTAFSRLDQLRALGPNAAHADFAIPAVQLTDWNTIQNLAVNDFEPIAREIIPGFDDLKSRLTEADGAPVLLSGSGSSVFAVFESVDQLSSAELATRELGVETRRATTLRVWPRPSPRH